jgi:hypothetical protein
MLRTTRTRNEAYVAKHMYEERAVRKDDSLVEEVRLWQRG